MSTAVPPSKLFSPGEAAAFLGVRQQTLSLWRSTGRYALPYVRVGRSIKYRVSDLEQWLADRTATHTEESRRKRKGRQEVSDAE